MDTKTMAQQMFKTGTCSFSDPSSNVVRVTFGDREDLVSDEIPVVNTGGWAVFNGFPDVGEQAACLFLGNGLSDGICLGVVPDYLSELTDDQRGITFDDGSYAYYDRSDKTMYIKTDRVVIDAKEIVLESDTQASVKLYANLTVYGEIKQEPPVKG